MPKLSLKTRLCNNELTVGSWISLAHPAIAEIMAKAGYDWLTIDLEHSSITLREAEELIRVINLCGVVPLVRLTSNDADQIKRVMDSGAAGIIVPMVNYPSDAEAAVMAVYYPPKGKRGVGLARAQGYGSEFHTYKEWLSKEAIIIVQIEHISAVNNVEAILSVEGIDGYIIGPYDLSASMGLPGQLDHPDVVAQIVKTREAGKRIAKPGGVHVVEPDLPRLRQCIQDGFRFIAYGVDIRFMDTSARAGMAEVRRTE